MERVETVIVGGGAMGLAAAWHLARRGRQVLLLERETIGHRRRRLARINPQFQPGVLGSALHRDAGRVPAGCGPNSSMRAGRPCSTPSVSSTMAPIPRSVTCMRRCLPQAYRCEFLPPAEARRRWPGIRFDSRVLYTPQSGRLRADAALSRCTMAPSHAAQRSREATRCPTLACWVTARCASPPTTPSSTLEG